MVMAMVMVTAMVTAMAKELGSAPVFRHRDPETELALRRSQVSALVLAVHRQSALVSTLESQSRAGLA